jgi:hypothetical protein
MDPWSFNDGLKTELWRRFVSVPRLCSEHGLTREQLLSARDREPANHVSSKTDFQHSGQQPTHLAYNPDGMTPLAPGRATDDLGPQLPALQKRRRTKGSSTGSSETWQTPSKIDNRATEAPTTEEQPHRRKKSTSAAPTPKQLAALDAQNAERQGAASRRYQEGLREATRRGDEKLAVEKQQHLDDLESCKCTMQRSFDRRFAEVVDEADALRDRAHRNSDILERAEAAIKTKHFDDGKLCKAQADLRKWRLRAYRAEAEAAAQSAMTEDAVRLARGLALKVLFSFNHVFDSLVGRGVVARRRRSRIAVQPSGLRFCRAGRGTRDAGRGTRDGRAAAPRTRRYGEKTRGADARATESVAEVSENGCPRA